MIEFEPVLNKYNPDWLLVVGDVNSTLACALVAAKLGVKIVHVEAGLRSGDWSMPEEINRVLTDRISNLLLTPSEDANHNLAKEGVDSAKVRFVGNVMIDSLVRLLPVAQQSQILNHLELSQESFVLVTLHRPANVDDPDVLKIILEALENISYRFPVVFPIHPRTRKTIQSNWGDTMNSAVRFIEPLGYLDFLCLTNSARAVITDSGGIQEEASFLGVSCLTVRPNTERPVTISHGTNQLVEANTISILSAFDKVMDTPSRKYCSIPLWDGFTAKRIMNELLLLN
jgi:UDP-N-acetylglucosamine 2-epimerase (non-hydrolysing)